MEGPRVILVEPQTPANVGFAARVLANFGLDDWAQVGGADWRGTEAERTGAMAGETLEALRLCTTLEEAAADSTHLLGFTARTGRQRRAVSLNDLAALRAEWGSEARVALVFGREDRGLEVEEAERCAALCTIPLPGLASLNLSHAIAIALYEWFRGEVPAPPESKAQAWSTAADRARLAVKAHEELWRRELPVEEAVLDATLRRLSAGPMEARDLRILEKIVRHSAWLRENSVRRD